jgi:peptide/nickel transport system ATP-binding protein
MAEIVLDQVTKTYRGGVNGVDGLSLDIAVGPSGCGKSTALRSIAGLEEITGGTISIGGRVVNDVPPKDRDVAMVFQNYALYPHMTVEQNLAFGLRQRKTPREEIRRRVAEVAQMLGIEQYLERKPAALSGGQRQRVAIARALAVRPRVLLADEPVSMLDVSIRLGILNLLAGLRENEGMTILYITHDIASARYLADEIAVMYAGRLVESAPAISVTDQPAHPYTQLLLSAAPDPDRPEPVQLSGRGSVPSLLTPPPGCRFHPRCPHAMAICSQLPPPPAEAAPGHVSACWLHAPERPAEAAGPPERRPDGPPTQLADDPSHQQGRQTRPTLRHLSLSRPRHGQSKEAGDEPAGH